MGNNDFDLDNFSFDDSEQDNDFFGSSVSSGDVEDDGFEGFGTSDSYDRKATKKTALVAIICGIVLIFGIFGIVKFINRPDKVKSDTQQNNQVTNEQVNSPVNNQYQSQTNNGQSTSNTGSDGWVEIQEYGNITWGNKNIDSTFSVTSKKYYLKIIDSNNFEIKAKLFGALAGFTGTYEIEVPYSVAVQVPVGEHFIVSVQLGQDPSGKNVIGEISYD